MENEIKMMYLNKTNYDLYIQEVSNIIQFGQFFNVDNKLKEKKLLMIEKEVFESKKLKPTILFCFQVSLHCSQINGRVYDTKEKIFAADQILQLIKRLNNKSGSFYNDKEIWASISRVERGRVSNKMRFSIYKRDGYRCRMCGATGHYDS